VNGSFTASKLEIQFSMLHNEVLDARSSSVKISNIFIDTLDGVNLFAQFEVTSMDHYTKSFNLTFNGCELLEHLNVSHSMKLPPNKSMMVNLTIPLPFYAENKEEKCEGIRMFVPRNAILTMLLIVSKLISYEHRKL
jgi:hypothetical protein